MLGFLRILSYWDVYCVWQPKQHSKYRNLTSEAAVIMLFALCTGALPPLTFIRALLYWMNKWTHTHAHTQNSLIHQHSSQKVTEWVFTATVSKASCLHSPCFFLIHFFPYFLLAFSKNVSKFLHLCIDSRLLITQEKPHEDTKKEVKGPLLCNINLTTDL